MVPTHGVAPSTCLENCWISDIRVGTNGHASLCVGDQRCCPMSPACRILSWEMAKNFDHVDGWFQFVCSNASVDAVLELFGDDRVPMEDRRVLFEPIFSSRYMLGKGIALCFKELDLDPGTTCS